MLALVAARENKRVVCTSVVLPTRETHVRSITVVVCDCACGDSCI